MSAHADRLLADATRRIRADDLPGALDALLQAWRQSRHAAFADRVSTLGDYLGALLPPVTGKNPSHQHERWLACAADAQPVDHARLAAGFALPPMTRIYQRLQWVAGQPTDPRWTPHVVSLAVQHARDYWPRLAPSPRRIWALCVKILIQMQDPASLAGLQPECLPVNPDPRDPRGAYAAFIERIDGLRERLRAFNPGDAPSAGLLTDFDAALAARRRRATPAAKTLRRATNRQDAALLDLIYAEPADVDVRRVYADWLETTGAPRGELMRLQLQQLDAPKPSKTIARRITRLTERYGARWLGRLRPFMRNIDWHLGFPNAADIVFRSAEQRDAALKLDAWRTFTAVHVRDAAVLQHPNLAGVTQLGRTAALSESQPRLTPLDVDVIASTAGPLPGRHLILEAGALGALKPAHWPGVRAMDIVGWRRLSELRALEQFECDALTFWGIPNGDIKHVVGLLGQTPRLRFTDDFGFGYQLDQDDGQAALDIIWVPTRPCDDFTPAIRVVKTVAPRSIRIQTPNHRQPADFLRTWQAALAPIPVKLPRAHRRRRAAQ